MLVQPVSIVNRNISVSSKQKQPSFKSVDYSAYNNYEGGPIPEIEQVKYHKTRLADELEKLEKYAEAAEEWFDIARICRQQGKERDAYLCDTTAHKLLRRIHR